MDRGVWWATVHGVKKSRTQLSDWTIYTHACSCSVMSDALKLLSIGSQSVGHNWLYIHECTYIYIYIYTHIHVHMYVCTFVCVLHLYHFFMCSGPAFRSPSEARSFRKGCPHPFQSWAWWCLAARTLGASHAPKGTSPPPQISPPPAPFPQSTERHFNFDFGQL